MYYNYPYSRNREKEAKELTQSDKASSGRAAFGIRLHGFKDCLFDWDMQSYSKETEMIHSKPLYICYELNGIPPKNVYVEVLTPSPSECDYIWRKGL